MSTPKTRPATKSDGQRIGEISFRSHTISYRHFARSSYIKEQVESEHIKQWNGVLADSSHGYHMFVVEWDGKVVGFSMVGPLNENYEFAEDVKPLGTDGVLAVLYSIHVDPDRLGQGDGTELMRATLKYLRDAGFSIVVLDTHEANWRSRHFYDAGGWEVVTTVNSDEGESMAIYRIRLA